MLVKTIETKNKNKIELIELAPNSYDKTVLIIGVFHGDEPEGEDLIVEFLKTCDKNKFKNRLIIVPCLNPDGKILKTRQNANKVDLNRNFPTKNWEKTEKNDYYGGDMPASEIETKFLIEIIENNKINAILTLHTPYKVVNYDGPAKELSKEISKITGYKEEEYIGYETKGSFGTYVGKEKNIPTITLELPDDEDFAELWQTNEKVFEYLTKQY